ncbi:uncharacterized protein MYCFIDRAFT_170398 [Pseudocercospora fijiensis CIRAD86]|uniref:Uncharacterized protein n=1 Tax=Pseudocercospora fijiensis (strain CIRAD86) TaxID=383855 RepID=N1QAF3_PSEFD|nr:uncharacterized protein MYCFIDRAFT_170398 [Pseudocercospora fijiensis CIRAD86]EME88826.1 hypothetical protein MYCFIDRAFT_170398 [Pseudocercospora fijiensis CIRAD86]
MKRLTRQFATFPTSSQTYSELFVLRHMPGSLLAMFLSSSPKPKPEQKIRKISSGNSSSVQYEAFFSHTMNELVVNPRPILNIITSLDIREREREKRSSSHLCINEFDIR